MTLTRILATGVAGAAAVTVVHELARRFIDSAPRMDVVGKRGIRRMARVMGKRPPRGDALYYAALGGEVLSNSLYYALVGVGQPRRPVLRGLALGALAGYGGVTLTPRLGLGSRPVRRTPVTAGMTFGFYTLGGLVAGLAQRTVRPRASSHYVVAREISL